MIYEYAGFVKYILLFDILSITAEISGALKGHHRW